MPSARSLRHWWGDEARAPIPWLVCAFGIGCVPLLVAWHALGAIALAGGVRDGVAMVIAVGLGVLAVDLLTGLVHWACDTWGDEDVPVLGPGLIHSFREHHVDPLAMLRHDFVEVNREPALASAAMLGLALLSGVQAFLEANLSLYAGFVGFVAYGAFANQLHYWAHLPSPPAPVRWLQRVRLILSPAAHARHHAAPNTDAYCISTGWLNPLLDRVGFWRGLEACVSRLTGARPRA